VKPAKAMRPEREKRMNYSYKNLVVNFLRKSFYVVMALAAFVLVNLAYAVGFEFEADEAGRFEGGQL
jgi:hypothetical protein